MGGIYEQTTPSLRSGASAGRRGIAAGPDGLMSPLVMRRGLESAACSLEISTWYKGSLSVMTAQHEFRERGDWGALLVKTNYQSLSEAA